MSDWHTRWKCPDCEVLFREVGECCSECGCRFDGWKLFSRWYKYTVRWVATGKLLKPSTWGTGHWQYKGSELGEPEG